MSTEFIDIVEDQEEIIADATETGIMASLTAQVDMDEPASEETVVDPSTESESLFQIVANDNGRLIDDTILEAEVKSFIDQYKDKDITQVDQPAVVFSQLRRLHKRYCERIESSGTISKGVLTKYGIQRMFPFMAGCR